MEPTVAINRRTREGFALTWSAVGLIAAMSWAYAAFGSPISGLATSSVAFALIFTSIFVPQNVGLAAVGYGVTAVSWLMTFVVAARTGGLESPGILWCFLYPISGLLISGRRAAIIWTCLALVQLGAVYAYDDLGVTVHYDLTAGRADLFRNVGFVLVVLGVALLISGADSARRAHDAALKKAEQTLERQRVLADMHDGIGGQLVGLIVQVRADTIDRSRLLQGLNTCLDDLRFIVDSLDPRDRSFEFAVGELRSRLEARCSSTGVQLHWTAADEIPELDATRTLQVLRFVQEATTNALVHSQTDRLDVSIQGDAARLAVCVRDYGVGFDPLQPPRRGRGLSSMRARAQRLSATIEFNDAGPGMSVRLVL